MLNRTPSLLRRQALLLHLLRGLGGNVTNVAFQKSLFFLCRKEEEDGSLPSYDFFPYKKGGFSFTADFDKYKLQEKGYLSDRSSGWELNMPGAPSYPSVTSASMRRLNEVFLMASGASDEELIRRMYDEFPEYALNSTIAEKVLKDRPDLLETIHAGKPQPGERAIRTIGYEGLTIEEYLKRLHETGVTMLCDVRRVPFSHKVGFSQRQLRELCHAVHIEYRHFPELGIPSHRRRFLHSQEDYDALFDEYERIDLPRASGALNAIAALARNEHYVALTCFEADPRQCHRSVVGKYLASMTSLPLVHLTSPSSICRKELTFLF